MNDLFRNLQDLTRQVPSKNSVSVMGNKDPLYGLNWAALVCPLLLPVSFLWDLVSYWSLLASYWMARGATTHEDKVRGVQEQVIIF